MNEEHLDPRLYMIMLASPELRRVLHLDLASLVDKVAVFLEEVDALLSVGRDVVVLVLKHVMDTLTKYTLSYGSSV